MFDSAASDARRGTYFWRLWAPLGLLGLTLIFGTWGFYDFLQALARVPEAGLPEPRLRDAFFHAAGLPILETADIPEVDLIPPQLDLARFLGLSTLAYASGLAVLALFGDFLKGPRIRAWRWLPGSRRSGHAVICGLGWRADQLVRDLIRKGWRVVVIDNDPYNPLDSSARASGAILLKGDAADTQVLARADVPAAGKVFIPGDSDETNLRVLKQIASLRKSRPGARPASDCVVHVQHARLRETVHSSIGAEGGTRITCFDAAETTARILMDRRPIEGDAGDTRSDVHVIILGDTSMARALLLQAMLIGQYPPGRRLRVTVLSEDLDRARERFLRTYPCYAAGALGTEAGTRRLQQDVLPRIDFAQLPLSDGALLDPEAGFLNRIAPDSVTTLYVCLDEGIRSSADASTLLPALGERARSAGARVSLFYFYDYPGDDHGPLVEDNLKKLETGVAVETFSAFVGGCTLEAVEGRPADTIAREMASFFRRLYGSPSWEQMSEADRMSNRRAADHVRTKFRAIGVQVREPRPDDEEFRFTEEEVDLLAELEHRRWCAERLLSGWRPLPRTPENLHEWRARKEQLKRTKVHVDLVPFDMLNEQDRGKDRALIQGMPGFLLPVGLVPVRSTRPQIDPPPLPVPMPPA